MMVVVSGPSLVTRRMSCRLDPAHQPGRGARVQHVIHRLAGDRAESGPYRHRHLISRRMRMLGQPFQHGQPRRRDPQPSGVQLFTYVFRWLPTAQLTTHSGYYSTTSSEFNQVFDLPTFPEVESMIDTGPSPPSPRAASYRPHHLADKAFEKAFRSGATTGR